MWLCGLHWGRVSWLRSGPASTKFLGREGAGVRRGQVASAAGEHGPETQEGPGPPITEEDFTE